MKKLYIMPMNTIVIVTLYLDIVSTFKSIHLSTTSEFIESYGYPCETYDNVITDDQYILSVHRIPYGKMNVKEPRNPVLLMHSLSGNSAEFVALGPERGLAYILAEAGYDVWLGNARGTRFSRRHKTFDPDKDDEYWQYSFHEVGIYDLPATLQLINNVTGHEKFGYIGYSQGCTSFYVMISEMPHFNRNITLMVSLAPVAYVTHLYNPWFRILARYEFLLTPLSRILRINEIHPFRLNPIVAAITSAHCDDNNFSRHLCANIVFNLVGFDYPQYNSSFLSKYLNNVPSGLSSKQLLHYAQGINSGRFGVFDYGSAKNLKIYGSSEARNYNLNNIITPIALFYAQNDWLCNITDVKKLASELPNVIYEYKVPHIYFNHFDYILAQDVVKLVYNNVLFVMKQYIV